MLGQLGQRLVGYQIDTTNPRPRQNSMVKTAATATVAATTAAWMLWWAVLGGHFIGGDTFSGQPLSGRPVLTLPFNELCEVLGGSGRAKIMWESLKVGRHPLLLPPTEGLSERVRATVRGVLGDRPLIETDVTEETLSDCGTRKFLQRLGDGQSVESVLIPAYKFDRTTLCVSTQIGCDRGCAFCLTGKMGLLRNLTSAEILSQVFNGLHIAARERMPPMSNVVFMGMGDAGRNLDAVGDAVAALADRDRFAMAAAKITISTVGPSPETFHRLARMPGTLAWSLHSPDDEIRRRLVPSTRHTAVELRDGLVDALKTRAAMRTRTIMVALTLIDGINDSPDDAHKLADFLRPMLHEVPKIAIDLIPYNDIEVRTFTSLQPNHPWSPLFDPPWPRSCLSSASRARSASAPFKT